MEKQDEAAADESPRFDTVLTDCHRGQEILFFLFHSFRLFLTTAISAAAVP